MRNEFSDGTLDKIIASLPACDGQPIGAREVHRQIGCWAQSSIRNALWRLEREGRVQSVLTPRGNGSSIRLWKNMPATAIENDEEISIVSRERPDACMIANT